MRVVKGKKHISTFQIISLGFLLVILVGSLLLMLPFATVDGSCTSFADALFTSTSAVCVTGLVVHDTATYWSAFGQFVILLLIQIGGLGVVTITLTIAMFSGRKIGLMQRSTMQEAISAPKMSGIVRMTGFILKTVFIFELAGAIALSTVFCKEFGFFKGVWYALFHSVSAFCNAGFDLMGIKEEYSSLTSYATQPLVNVVIMILIIVGGIGFFTWEDIKTNKWKFKRYRMQSKVILVVTAFLIVLPTIYFFFCEYSYLPMGERFLSSAFQAVTPRTAGFNTTDLTQMTEVGRMVIIILMMIGGSPGSTAGGMKTTTIAVLFSTGFSVFRRKEDVVLFKRRISEGEPRNAGTILMMYLTLCLSGSMIISYLDGIPLMDTLFETASAIGTVGLSIGVTSQACSLSRAILIGLMFFGRVGGLTLVFAAASSKNYNISRYPKEKITLG